MRRLFPDCHRFSNQYYFNSRSGEIVEDSCHITVRKRRYAGNFQTIILRQFWNNPASPPAKEIESSPLPSHFPIELSEIKQNDVIFLLGLEIQFFHHPWKSNTMPHAR